MRLSAEIVDTFRSLLAEAEAAGEIEPTAMTLATSGADGTVSARTVLLKDVDDYGFVFYTNTESLKGRQLHEHPRAALLFLWKRLREQVQVRIEGTVDAVAPDVADAYFATRPRASQIGAWASIQSAPLPSRDAFEARIAQFDAQFDGREVPRPPHWSGYRVRPQRVEFWYGVKFRLHERVQHEWRDGGWQQVLLYP
jgi:pyridoxamine 5'-phosphate oxidase